MHRQRRNGFREPVNFRGETPDIGEQDEKFTGSGRNDEAAGGGPGRERPQAAVQGARHQGSADLFKESSVYEKETDYSLL